MQPPGGPGAPAGGYEILGAVKIKDGVFIGDELAAQDLEFVVANKVTHIINCCGRNVPNHWESIGVVYLTYYWVDNENQIILDNKDVVANECFHFLEEALGNAESVLIHSVRGQSRSCVVLAGYMMRKYCWGLRKTMEFLTSRRPDISLKPAFLQQLSQYERRLVANSNKKFTVDWSETPGNSGLDGDELLLRNTYMNSHIENLSKKEDKPGSQNPHNRRLEWSDSGNDDKGKLEKTPGGDRPHCKTGPNGQFILKSIIKAKLSGGSSSTSAGASSSSSSAGAVDHAIGVAPQQATTTMGSSSHNTSNNITSTSASSSSTRPKLPVAAVEPVLSSIGGPSTGSGILHAESSAAPQLGVSDPPSKMASSQGFASSGGVDTGGTTTQLHSSIGPSGVPSSVSSVEQPAPPEPSSSGKPLTWRHAEVQQAPRQHSNTSNSIITSAPSAPQNLLANSSPMPTHQFGSSHSTSTTSAGNKVTPISYAPLSSTSGAGYPGSHAGTSGVPMHGNMQEVSLSSSSMHAYDRVSTTSSTRDEPGSPRSMVPKHSSSQSNQRHSSSGSQSNSRRPSVSLDSDQDSERRVKKDEQQGVWMNMARATRMGTPPEKDYTTPQYPRRREASPKVERYDPMTKARGDSPLRNQRRDGSVGGRSSSYDARVNGSPQRHGNYHDMGPAARTTTSRELGSSSNLGGLLGSLRSAGPMKGPSVSSSATRLGMSAFRNAGPVKASRDMFFDSRTKSTRPATAPSTRVTPGGVFAAATGPQYGSRPNSPLLRRPGSPGRPASPSRNVVTASNAMTFRTTKSLSSHMRRAPSPTPAFNRAPSPSRPRWRM
ncbi:unnamed protein product [Amoebophrya sp. A120]|nr:unnamed protein product [Amoebophrya sp. A120]|eukprot:GSA120T00010839001.1